MAARSTACAFAALDDRTEWKNLLNFSDLDETPKPDDPPDIDETRAGHRVVSRLVQSFTQNLEKSPEGGGHFPVETPICTASHESKLLTEPFEQPLPDGSLAPMRPCITGCACLGFHERIKDRDVCGGGCALREMLFPEELARFEKTGELPDQPKACVLCHRQQMLQVYLLCQGAGTDDKVKFADAHINLYVNPRDCEDGYVEEQTIPFAKASGWSHMIGAVAINRFPLYRWAHGSTPAEKLQSRELCAYFKGRLKHEDALFGDLFGASDVGARADAVWTPPGAWERNARMDGTFGALTRLVSRVDATCSLLAARTAWPAAIHARLHVFLQAHCDLIVKCERRESGPSQAMTRAADPPPNDVARVGLRIALGLVDRSTKSFEDVLANLLGRALSSSTNNKVFFTFLQKQMSNKQVSAFVQEAMWATFAGTYHGCHPSVGVRTLIALARVRRMPTPDFAAKIVQLQNECPRPIAVAVLQEYFFRAIDEDNALTPFFEARCGAAWGHMRQGVYTACDALREAVTAALYSFDAPAGETLERLWKDSSPHGHLFHKSYRRLTQAHVIRRRPLTPCQMLLKRLGALPANDDGDLGDMTVAEEVPVDVVNRYIREATPGARALLARVHDQDAWKKAVVATEAEADLACAAVLGARVLTLVGIRFVALPEGLAAAQRAALLRRFSTFASPEEAIEKASTILCCLRCRTVKNFYIANEKVKKKSISKSHGYRGVACMDEKDGVAELVCQSRRPRHQSGACSRVGLTRVPLLGERARALLFFDMCLTISPCCGHVCDAMALKVLPGGMMCPHCARAHDKPTVAAPPTMCYYCNDETGKFGKPVHVSHDGETVRELLCKKHARRWLAEKSVWDSQELKTRLAKEGLFKMNGRLKKRFYR